MPCFSASSAQALTYGEVEYLGFLQMLDFAYSFNNETNGITTRNTDEGDIFFDLGCGAGKALIAAALSGRKMNWPPG